MYSCINVLNITLVFTFRSYTFTLVLSIYTQCSVQVLTPSLYFQVHIASSSTLMPLLTVSKVSPHSSPSVHRKHTSGIPLPLHPSRKPLSPNLLTSSLHKTPHLNPSHYTYLHTCHQVAKIGTKLPRPSPSNSPSLPRKLKFLPSSHF